MQLVPLERVVAKARAQLQALGCLDCAVFVMTNCRDGAVMARLADELPTMITCEPWRSLILTLALTLSLVMARLADELPTMITCEP